MAKRAGFRATLAALGFEKLLNQDIDGDGQVRSHSLSRTHTRSLSHSLSHTHTHTLAHALTHSLSHTRGQVGEPKMLAGDMAYLPGDLGFDPLGLFKGNEKQKMSMQLKEVNNGRLAMIAITGYALQEAATKVSVLSAVGVPAV
jgi:hypothetical protein